MKHHVLCGIISRFSTVSLNLGIYLVCDHLLQGSTKCTFFDKAWVSEYRCTIIGLAHPHVRLRLLLGEFNWSHCWIGRSGANLRLALADNERRQRLQVGPTHVAVIAWSLDA